MSIVLFYSTLVYDSAGIWLMYLSFWVACPSAGTLFQLYQESLIELSILSDRLWFLRHFSGCYYDTIISAWMSYSIVTIVVVIKQP